MKHMRRELKHFITEIRYLGENYVNQDWKFSNEGKMSKNEIANLYSLVFKEIEKERIELVKKVLFSKIKEVF